MAGVRAEILAASRSRTGWLEQNMTEEEQHLGTGNKPPFIDNIKTAFEEKDGSYPNSPTRMEPVRKLGSKVSSIANMFQALSPQKEEKTMITSKTVNAKLKYMQENTVVKSESGNNINNSTQNCQPEPPPPPPPPHTAVVSTKMSSLSRTESHVARFNNAKAMFENLEARKQKQPMSLSSPKKIPPIANNKTPTTKESVSLTKRDSPPPPPPPHANKNRAAAIEEARTLIQPVVVDGVQPLQPVRTTSSPRGSFHEITLSPRVSISEITPSPRVSLHEESVNKNNIEAITDPKLLNRANQNVVVTPRTDAQKTYKDSQNRASSNQIKENSNLDQTVNLKKPDVPQPSAIENEDRVVSATEKRRASTDLSLNLVVENGGTTNHCVSSDEFQNTPESNSPSPVRKRESSNSNSDDFPAYDKKYVKHNTNTSINDFSTGGQNVLMNFVDDKENRSITPEYNDNWQDGSDVGRIKNFYGRTSASDNLRDSGGETLAEFESREQELFLVEAVLGTNTQNGQSRKDHTFLGSPVDDVELMTQEEADQLLSKRTRKSLLSDDEAQEVEYLLSQDACSSNRDSTVNSYSDVSEDGASEVMAQSQSVEACVIHDDVEYHVFPDGHYFVETPGLPPEDTDEDNMFFCTIPPKKKNRVQFSTAPIKMYSTHSVEDYDRHNDDVDPVSASAEYELEKRIENMDVFPVEILKGPEGLGLSIIGMGVGADAGLEKLGIFIKTITECGAASKDGRIKVNDQIIEVDGKSLVGVTQAYAASVLRSTSGLVRFLIGRDKEGPNSEIAQLISLSLQADKEQQDQNQNSQSDDAVRNYVMSPCETSVEDDDDQKSTDSSQNSVQDEGDHIGHSDSYDLIAASTCSDSASTSDDPEILKAKLKEWQLKYAVTDAELKQLKAKSEADQSEWLKQLEFLKGKLSETESTLQNARKDIMGCQQHVQDTEEQCIMLQKKYRKAKKIIREYQKKEQELIEQHDNQLQQMIEKDKEYNDLVKALKERISLLETNIVDLQKQIGLPVTLPFDHTARLFNNVSKKASTYQKTALNMKGTKKLELDVSDSETSDNDSGKYEVTPDTEEGEGKKFSTLERRKRNEEFLNKAVPQTELLDITAAKSKAELVSKGSLANRQPPTLKKQCSSNSIDEMVQEETGQIEENSNKTYTALHHQDLPPPTPIVDYSPQENQDPTISFRSSWTSASVPNAAPRITSIGNSHPDPAINELYAYPKKIPKVTKEERNENEKDDSTEKDISARSSIIETTSRSTLSLDVGASGSIVKEPQHHSVTTTTLTATVSAVNNNNRNNPTTSSSQKSTTRQYVRPQHLGSFTPGSRDSYVSFTDELVRKVIQKFAQSSDRSSATGGGCYFNDETRKSLGLGLTSPTESIGNSKRISYNGCGSLGYGKFPPARNGPASAAEDDGVKGAQYFHHPSESSVRKSETIQSPRSSEGSPIGGRPLAFWQASPAHDWTSEDVGQWMSTFGLQKYVPQFIQSNISGQILIQLDSARLKNLGVVNGADRTLLKKKIKEMRSQIDRERKAHEREIKAKEKQLKKADKKKK